jgi:hypothetical protein
MQLLVVSIKGEVMSREYRAWNSEPWKRDGLTIYCGERPNHLWIATAIAGGDHKEYPVDIANMQRAVDCVNAMQGISDPAAFVQMVRDVIEQARIDRAEEPMNCPTVDLMKFVEQLADALPTP